MANELARELREDVMASGVVDGRVLDAVEAVPRHRFVRAEDADFAYANSALPIGYGQTISQPSVVALMTETLAVEPGMRVLEIGTGSGYQAAVLAWLGAEVFSIEVVEPLAMHAQKVLAELGVKQVHIRTGDGNRGWPEEAPFDRIIATAAARRIPRALLAQLKPDGILVMPLEDADGGQNLVRVTVGPGGPVIEPFCSVRFVPFVGGDDGN